MQCNYCGKELPEGSAFCNYCGHPQNETAKQSSPDTPTPATAAPHEDEGTLRCPHCGSTRLQYTTTVKTQGVSADEACCGYICLGPLGLLCGLCGAGSTETKEGWVCCDCGTNYGMAADFVIALLGVLIFVIALLTSSAVGYGILLAIIGIAVLAFFSQKDDKLFDQYASSSLRAMKEEKEQAIQHKAELKKYREAYQGLKADENKGS